MHFRARRLAEIHHTSRNACRLAVMVKSRFAVGHNMIYHYDNNVGLVTNNNGRNARQSRTMFRLCGGTPNQLLIT